MKTRAEKIEEAADRFSAAADRTTKNLEKLEQRLKDLDTDTPRNKIIIWTVAAIIAAIIIALRS
jgi:predicted  nucleic acid-binding Zn-ribbon protein